MALAFTLEKHLKHERNGSLETSTPRHCLSWLASLYYSHYVCFNNYILSLASIYLIVRNIYLVNIILSIMSYPIYISTLIYANCQSFTHIYTFVIFIIQHIYIMSLPMTSARLTRLFSLVCFQPKICHIPIVNFHSK